MEPRGRGNRIQGVPRSWLRRPLLWLLVAYGALLWRRRQAGPFCPPPDPALLAAGRAPRRVEAMALGPAAEDQQGAKVEARLLSVDGRPEPGDQRALVRLSRATIFDLPRPGERFEAEGPLVLPREARNPGDFDERRLLADRGVQWSLRASSLRATAPAGGASRVLAAAESVRRAVERAYRAELPEVDARLMAGLTLGFKGPLPRALSRAVQDAGVMHLLVPSGAKEAFVLAALALAGRVLGAPPWACLALEASGGGFFVLLVGAQPPYVRAYVAWTAARAGRLLGRDAGALHALVLAAWAQLLWRPAALFSLGFQMTYAAAAALACGLPALAGAVSRRRGRLARAALLALAVTALVEAALWPLLAASFGRAALCGALANAVLVPAAWPLEAGGFGLAAARAAGLRRLAGALAAADGAALSGFQAACRFFSSLPLAAVELSPLAPEAAAAYYLALCALTCARRARVRALLLAVSAALWLGGLAVRRARAPELEAVYLSLPRGRRCAVVRRAGGAPTLVVDGRAFAAPRKAALALGWGEPAETVLLDRRPGWLACDGRVCFSFARPAVRSRRGECSIIPVLRDGAARVSTDGNRVEIREKGDQFGRCVFQRVEARGRPHDEGRHGGASRARGQGLARRLGRA